MKRLQLDPATNDLFFRNGDLVIVTSGDSVAEALRARLQTFRGEYFLDLEYGFPYYQAVFTDYPADDATLRQLMLGVLSGITDPSIETIEITDITLDPGPGSLGWDITVTLSDGETLSING